jgi:DNA repair photolyase
MVIVVPSRGRADTCTTQEIFPEAIFYVPKSEYEAYKKRMPKQEIIIADIENETIGKKRQFILDQFPVGEHIVFCDDDLTGYVRKVNDKEVENVPIDEMRELFEEWFLDLELSRVSMWGMCGMYDINPMFLTDKIHRLTQLAGMTYGVIKREDIGFTDEISTKEDFEYTLKCIERDGMVRRYSAYNPVASKYNSKGGCSTYRTDEVQKRDALWLVEHYPDLVKLNPRKEGEVLMKVREAYYGSPRWTGEILDCSMPMTFDTYSSCSYKCLYCFSYFQRIHSSKSYVNNIKYVNVEKIKKLFRGEIKNSQFNDYIREKRVMQWGGLSEPFDLMEKKNGVTLELLKFFAEIQYPLSICTKSTWFLEDERYTTVIKKMKDILHFKFTIITGDLEKSKAIERNTPTPDERLEAIRKLRALGVKHITLRLRPFIIGVSDIDATDLIRRAKEAGADSVSTEFLCIEGRADERVKKRYEKMSKVTGFDILKFYRLNSRGAGYLRLNYDIKKKYAEEMHEACKKYGLRFYVSDAHHKEKCDNGSCCGLPCSMNYSRNQFTEAIVIAREKGEVTWGDISKGMDMFKKFDWGNANGFNTGSAEKRAQFKGVTMYEWMRSKWNNPNDANSPYRYFDKVLYPVRLDKEGNIVYKFNPERRNLPSELGKK